MARPLYVETVIRAPLDELWRRTQDPAQHQRWDVRFTRISYLPRLSGSSIRFHYATRVAPGLTVTGVGVTVGQRCRTGSSTSALRFSSTDRRSLIRRGSGYWRYVPTDDGIRFLTGYQYVPGWGSLGPVADMLFRPLMGWATAWSFDRLRLWLERGVSPERALAHGLGELVVRLASIALLAPLAGRLTVLVGLALAVLPPTPLTPAARRCRRRPRSREATP